MKRSSLWQAFITATITSGSVIALIFRGPMPALICSAGIAVRIIPGAL